MSKRFGLAVAATAVALVLAEAVLRLGGVAGAGQGAPWFAGGNHPRFLFQPDEIAGYALRPGFAGRERSMFGEFDVPVAIDAEGLRSQRHGSGAGEPADPVILAVGDSMTFGEGVEADETFSALLEEATGGRVVNAGVPGYGSGQMLAVLDRLLARWHPRRVILTLSPLWDESRARRPFVYKEGFIVAPGYADRLWLIDGNLYLAEVGWPWIGPATAWAKAHSRLARLALPAGAALARGAAVALGGGEGDALSAEEAAGPTVANLWAAAERVTAAGAEPLVVLIDSRGEEFRRADEAVERALAASRIAVVALDERIDAGDWPSLRFPNDGHWNAAGHRRVAAVLAAEIGEGDARAGG